MAAQIYQILQHKRFVYSAILFNNISTYFSNFGLAAMTTVLPESKA